MKYLSAGLESKKKIDLLLRLTKINSDSIVGGIIDHLTRNFSVSAAANINGCKQPHLTAAINTLNEVAETVEKINELTYTSKSV